MKNSNTIELSSLSSSSNQGNKISNQGNRGRLQVYTVHSSFLPTSLQYICGKLVPLSSRVVQILPTVRVRVVGEGVGGVPRLSPYSVDTSHTSFDNATKVNMFYTPTTRTHTLRGNC